MAVFGRAHLYSHEKRVPAGLRKGKGQLAFFSGDDLVEITGAKSVDYKDKMMCCGAGGGLRARDLDVTTSFTKEKLDHMTAAGVDAIVNVCPFCHMQFDQGQTEVNERYGTDFALPVFHLAQLYGLAMGLSADELTFDAQLIDAAPVLAKLE